MNRLRTATLSFYVLAAAALPGCSVLPFGGSGSGADSTPRRAPAPAPARSQATLREGIDLYNQGDFNGAIRRLSSQEIASAPAATRVTAFKYTAFSYCVTARPVQCRQAFERALKLDPGFDLAPGEHGHPLWGPVFTRAKKGA